MTGTVSAWVFPYSTDYAVMANVRVAKGKAEYDAPKGGEAK